MAIAVGTRVRVSNQHSEHRNRLGVAMEDNGGDNFAVRLDGMSVGGTLNFDTNELQESTQPEPITYND